MTQEEQVLVIERKVLEQAGMFQGLENTGVAVAHGCVFAGDADGDFPFNLTDAIEKFLPLMPVALIRTAVDSIPQAQ